MGLGLLGLLVGLLGGFTHGVAVLLAGVPLPVGLVVGVAAPVALVRAWVDSAGRRGGAAVAAGWALAQILLLSVTAGGDVLLEASWQGYTFLYGGFLAVVAGAALPPRASGPGRLASAPPAAPDEHG